MCRSFLQCGALSIEGDGVHATHYITIIFSLNWLVLECVEFEIKTHFSVYWTCYFVYTDCILCFLPYLRHMEIHNISITPVKSMWHLN